LVAFGARVSYFQLECVSHIATHRRWGALL
jgi:hypothetical protein